MVSQSRSSVSTGTHDFGGAESDLLVVLSVLALQFRIVDALIKFGELCLKFVDAGGLGVGLDLAGLLFALELLLQRM